MNISSSLLLGTGGNVSSCVGVGGVRLEARILWLIWRRMQKFNTLSAIFTEKNKIYCVQKGNSGSFTQKYDNIFCLLSKIEQIVTAIHILIQWVYRVQRPKPPNHVHQSNILFMLTTPFTSTQLEKLSHQIRIHINCQSISNTTNIWRNVTKIWDISSLIK